MKNTIRASFRWISVQKWSKQVIYRAFCSRGSDDGNAGTWYAPHEVADMSRRDLQKWCKKLGIHANTKNIQMRADLVEFHDNVLIDSKILKYPFLPKQKPCLAPFQTSWQDKQFLNNIWTGNLATDYGLKQVRYYKNTCPIYESLYEDANNYFSTSLEASNTSESPEINRLPSVSKILRSTAPKSKLFAISHWMKKQKELLGEDVFQLKMNEIKKKGLDFHYFVHQCLMDKQLDKEIPEKLQGYLASTRKVFDHLGDAIASETRVQHTHLGYQGKFDTLACYHGNPCIVEWKTSQKRKSSLSECGEYPMQMVAYAGAINNDPTSNVQIRHSLLVIAYEDGTPADVHCLDLNQCKHFWLDWLVRLHKFKS